MLNAKTINITFLAILLAMIGYDWSSQMSPWWYAVLLIVYLNIQAYGASVLSAQFFLPVKYQGDTNSNKIAITFDDGPIPVMTEKVLDILSEYKAPAAFFCIGNRVNDYPALTRRIYESGHLIGNHSYWHGAMFDLQSAYKIAKELKDTDTAIQNVIHKKPNFFRPPFGVTNPMVAAAVKKGGYKTIGWSIRSFDTVTKNGSVLLERVTRSLKGGDIILFHDYSTTTLEILPAFLEEVAKLGLKIVRVDELLKEKAYV
ncbi:polysaccharide deacetylase family protein [Chryseolinea sp. H1M3-3]|uniref:polysaccharide deacetylase family protein n=1 Tax=Chryseolinea sp. H1M3-3 TaxID=3034144 RepID=UPI0023ED9647|nr:polysaccharide deacetylase family protein [Chryseolinea sp. H1M3-3]